MLSCEPHAPVARLIMRNNASLHMYEYYPPCITGRVAGVDDDDDDRSVAASSDTCASSCPRSCCYRFQISVIIGVSISRRNEEI